MQPGSLVRSLGTPRKRDLVRLIQGLVSRHRAQRVVGCGNPVGAEEPSDRAAVSVVPEIGCEKLLNCALIPGVQIDQERGGNPLNFPAPVFSMRLAYSTNTRGKPRVSLSASRLYFSHKAPPNSGEVRAAAVINLAASCGWRTAITATGSNPA